MTGRHTSTNARTGAARMPRIIAFSTTVAICRTAGSSGEPRHQPHDAVLRGLRARKLAGDPSLAQNDDARREVQDFGELARDEDHPLARRGELVDERVDFGLRADVHAARRLVEDQEVAAR